MQQNQLNSRWLMILMIAVLSVGLQACRGGKKSGKKSQPAPQGQGVESTEQWTEVTGEAGETAEEAGDAYSFDPDGKLIIEIKGENEDTVAEDDGKDSKAPESTPPKKPKKRVAKKTKKLPQPPAEATPLPENLDLSKAQEPAASKKRFVSKNKTRPCPIDARGVFLGEDTGHICDDTREESAFSSPSGTCSLEAPPILVKGLSIGVGRIKGEGQAFLSCTYRNKKHKLVTIEGFVGIEVSTLTPGLFIPNIRSTDDLALAESTLSVAFENVKLHRKSGLSGFFGTFRTQTGENQETVFERKDDRSSYFPAVIDYTKGDVIDSSAKQWEVRIYEI